MEGEWFGALSAVNINVGGNVGGGVKVGGDKKTMRGMIKKVGELNVDDTRVSDTTNEAARFNFNVGAGIGAANCIEHGAVGEDAMDEEL